MTKTFLILLCVFGPFILVKIPEIESDFHPDDSNPKIVSDFLREVEHYKLSQAERRRFRQLTATVTNYLRGHNIVHFLGYGSAIGALRHGQIIPSDDDFDLLVWGNREVLEAGPLSSLQLKKVGLSLVHAERFSKLFFSRPLPGVDITFREYAWHWPFVDLFFIHGNKTHLYRDPDPVHPDDWFMFPREMIFPLANVRMDGVSLPVMRCVRTILQKLFPGWMDEVCLGNWDHRRETWRGGQRRMRSPCLPSKLLKRYNFTFLDQPKNPTC